MDDLQYFDGPVDEKADVEGKTTKPIHDKGTSMLLLQWWERYQQEQSQFQSLSVFAEVKLIELFDITANLPNPHPIRTAVCAELLIRICDSIEDCEVRAFYGELVETLLSSIYVLDAEHYEVLETFRRECEDTENDIDFSSISKLAPDFATRTGVLPNLPHSAGAFMGMTPFYRLCEMIKETIDAKRKLITTEVVPQRLMIIKRTQKMVFQRTIASWRKTLLHWAFHEFRTSCIARKRVRKKLLTVMRVVTRLVQKHAWVEKGICFVNWRKLVVEKRSVVEQRVLDLAMENQASTQEAFCNLQTINNSLTDAVSEKEQTLAGLLQECVDLQTEIQEYKKQWETSNEMVMRYSEVLSKIGPQLQSFAQLLDYELSQPTQAPKPWFASVISEAEMKDILRTKNLETANPLSSERLSEVLLQWMNTRLAAGGDTQPPLTSIHDLRRYETRTRLLDALSLCHENLSSAAHKTPHVHHAHPVDSREAGATLDLDADFHHSCNTEHWQYFGAAAHIFRQLRDNDPVFVYCATLTALMHADSVLRDDISPSINGQESQLQKLLAHLCSMSATIANLSLSEEELREFNMHMKREGTSATEVLQKALQDSSQQQVAHKHALANDSQITELDSCLVSAAVHNLRSIAPATREHEQQLRKAQISSILSFSEHHQYADVIDFSALSTTDLTPIEEYVNSHAHPIRNIFRFYCTSATHSMNVTTNTMCHGEFWRFVRDCCIVSRGLVSSHIDLIFFNVVKRSYVSAATLLDTNTADNITTKPKLLMKASSSDEGKELNFAQFVESLVRLAVVDEADRVTSAEYLLDTIKTFIEAKVLPYASKKPRCSFYCEALASRDVERVFERHSYVLQKKFRSYSSISVATRGRNSRTVTLQQFQRFAQDIKMLPQLMKHRELNVLFKNVLYESDNNDDFDASKTHALELSYREFLESVAALAHYAVPLPYLRLDDRLERFILERL